MSELVNQQFERLLSKLTDAVLDEGEIRELGALIASDARLRNRYLEYCQIHAMLRAEHGLLASWGVPDLEVVPAPRREKLWRPMPWIAMCCAASVVAISAVAAWNYAIEQDVATTAQQPYRGADVARIS